ncbi:MAG: TonB family protein [Candidatus Acidiferrales bacterium]
MSENPQHADKKRLTIDERRLSVRAPVSPQAFVKFGANNYGFVFNISETGLVFSPTGTLTLAVGAVAKMRFLLPESREWIETSGEVAWIGDSQKEAGVRFVDLADETRARIRNWIAHEPSRAQPPHPRFAVPELGKSPQGDAPAPASSASLEAKPGTFVDSTVLNSILADPARLLRETKTARKKLAPQPAKTVEAKPRPAPNNVPVPDRRSHIRRRVLSLEYIDLGSFNGGILLNLSEGGMYVQAVAGLSNDELPELSFRLPDSTYVVKTNAQIAWTGESRKDAGIQFVNLSEEARLKIREWVALELPPVESANASDANVAPVRKKTERLLEMPSPGQSKKAANFPEALPRVPQSRDNAPAPSPVVASQKIVASEKPAASRPAELLHLSSPILQKRLGEPPKIRAEAHSEINWPEANSPEVKSPAVASTEMTSPAAAQPRSWRGLAAVIFVAVLLAFVAGWIVAGPGGRAQFLAMFDRQQSNASDSAQNSSPTPAGASATENPPNTPAANETSQQPAQQTPSAPVVTTKTPDKSQSANLNGSVPPSPSHSNGSSLSAVNIPTPQTQKSAPPVAHSNISPNASSATSRDTRSSQPSTPSTAPSSSATPAQNKAQAIQPVEQPRPVTAPVVSNSALKNSPSPAASNPSPQPSPSTVASQPPNPSPVATQPPTRVDTPPVIAKPPAPVEVVKGTVSVSASPFPSIRVPPEMKSQISKQGASLQLGQLISRVEPVYPEDAERQRIEGVVKLHVIIDRDGNIQNIDQTTGPPLLVAAAANAVRQWKYKPTSLGGQPVEAGVDVTATFRLQTTHAN